MSDLPRINRPCDECPWKVDAVPGRFTEERWRSLQETAHHPRRGSAPMHAPIFACHKTDQGRDRTCAGWLAQEGGGHVGIRIAVAQGRLPGEALQPGPDWPTLHATIAHAAAHDLGYELEEEY